jgi:glycogen synthase
LGQLSQKEVAEWLSKAWLYVLPAKYEPFGYTFLEAALSGCVLVGGDIESLHEIWNDKMIYATTDDPQHLADTVTKLFENEWQLNYLSRKTHEHALAKYTEDFMLKEYTELYKSLEKIKLKITQH